MSIYFNSKDQVFFLETENSSYQIKVDDTGCLRHLYYGKHVGTSNMNYRYRACDRGFSGNPYEMQNDRGCSFDVMPQEYSCYGAGDFRVSSLIIEDENGSHTADLRYDSYKISDGKYQLKGLPYAREGRDEIQTLEIVLRDQIAGISVKLLYGVYEKKDLITRTAQIFNESAKKIKLHKAASLCIDYPYGTYDLIHFHGKHCMERQMERCSLTRDVITVGSKRGMSSHHNNPFIILCDPHTDEDHGDCYGFMLMYSGNHKEEIEKDQLGSTRVVMGIHDEGFCWLLNPGEEFQTPEALLTYSFDGLNGLSQKYHKIIRENVCHPKYLEEKRPVLLNSWEATYFDFDEKKIYELGKNAKELGVELLVLDDGWFGKRDDDHRGLGDWFVNEDKLNNGLKDLVDRINDLGLKFGLWFEPEMINEDSELYRNHPEWVLRDPERLPMLSRNQMVLDMSRQDVRDYLFTCISDILNEANIEYIKWDFNRSIANVYSNLLPAEQQGEVAHRFILGTYELLERITTAFPDVLIEGCAGGGGRFDAGMLFYSPQIWCSDNTDAISRLKIQRGTSYGYPVSTMGSHVSASPNHQTGRETPLNTRGIVAMSGTFGYELDPAKLSEEEKQEIREQISKYHEYYWLIQNGTYYRLGNEEFDKKYSCWEFVSEDQKEILLNLVAADVEANAEFPFVKLKGLKENWNYRLENTDLVVSGAALMHGGYVFETLSGNYPAVQLHFVAD